MAKVTLEEKVERSVAGGQQVVTVTLHNPTKSIALMTHLQLRDAKTGERILPAYYSENYVSLLPGEERTVGISFPAGDGKPAVGIRGWNIAEGTVPAE